MRVRPALLKCVEVDGAAGDFANLVVVGVARQPHDFVRPEVAVHGEALADGAAAGEEISGEGLVDDGYAAALVLEVEVAAGEERSSESREVFRSHPGQRQVAAILGPFREAFDAGETAGAGAGERRARAQRSRAHAGDGFQAAQQFPIRTGQLFLARASSAAAIVRFSVLVN
jgi:hypothetical protein